MNNPERIPRGGLRDKLDVMNGAKPRVLMSPADVPGEILFWRVLLEPYEARHEGRIQTPEMIEQAEQVACSVGRILKLGSMAFKSRTSAGLNLADEPHLPKVGDYVKHQMYAGELIKLKGDNRKMRILNDTEIEMVITDPDQIRGYL